MHKHNIIKIIAGGTTADMEALRDVFDDLICDLKADNPELYKEAELRIHRIAYGTHLGEFLAKSWVSHMENKDGTVGQHWSWEETEQVRSQYAKDIDPSDWYAVLNMMYSDYYNPKLGTSDYIQLAIDWLRDKDVPDGKTLRYYYCVVC